MSCLTCGKMVGAVAGAVGCVLTGTGVEMLSARIVERPARFDRVDRVKAAVGQPVLPGDDRFWILGDPLVAQVDGGERIEVPVGFTTDGASVPDWAQTLTGWEPWEDLKRWAGSCTIGCIRSPVSPSHTPTQSFGPCSRPKGPARGSGS